MKKLIVNYDEITGTMTDKNGSFLGTYLGAISEEADTSEGVLELVKHGLSADDLVKLKNLDII